MLAAERPFGSLLSAVVDNRGRTCPTAESGIPLIATNSISNDHLYPTMVDLRYVSEETYQTWFRGHPQPGDILFVNKGSPGRVALVPNPVDFCIAQDMVAIRADEREIYPSYLLAALRTPGVQRRIEQMHVGTLIPHFKKTDFDKLYIPVPDRATQVRVGDMYLDFSKKIELNRQMNKTLEELARAIFKSWFVDFDPVHAKARGERPIGMDAATAALFPSDLDRCAFIDRRVGWEAIALGRVIEIVGGSTPSTKEPRFWDGQIAFATPRDMSKLHSPFMLATERQVTLSGAEKISSGVLPPGTLLMSSRAPIGYLAFATTDLCVNQGIVAMLPSDRTPLSFMWCWLQTNMDQVISRANGSTFLEISKSAFRSMTVELPPPEILSAFSRQVQPMLNLIRSNAEQNICLARMRDLLLPSLLNGQLL